MEERNETRETEEIPSNELDGNLSQFVLAARTKSRKECEPSSLRGILSSHERRLIRANYGQCIFKDSRVQENRAEMHKRPKQKKNSSVMDMGTD